MTSKKIDSSLGLFSVISISVGVMLGSGIFVLPGLALGRTKRKRNCSPTSPNHLPPHINRTTTDLIDQLRTANKTAKARQLQENTLSESAPHTPLPHR